MGTPLRGGFDHASRLALVPPRYTTKGMFFTTVTRHLSAGELAGLTPLLHSPPRPGRYLPFVDYPLRDLYLIAAEVARKLSPEAPPAEGLRHLSRRSLDVFGATLLGRVTLELVAGQPAAALELLPSMVMRMQRAGSMAATRRGDAITLQVRDYPYWVEGGVYGVIESVIVYFGGTPRLEVNRLSDADADVVARWR